MQRTKAVSLFVIVPALLCACGSSQPGIEPTQTAAHAPGATVTPVPATPAPTATALNGVVTLTPTTPITPPVTPTAEKARSISETIGLKEGEKVVWDGPDVSFVFDKAYNDAFDGVKQSPNFKDAATPDEYWHKTVSNYWVDLIKASGGDVTPDQVGSYLKEKGIKVPTTNLVKDADGKYTYDYSAVVTNPHIVVKAMDAGGLGSNGFLIGYDAASGTNVRAGIEVKNGVLILSIARGPSTMTRVPSRGFSVSGNLLGNSDLLLNYIDYAARGGLKDVFLGATVSSYEEPISKIRGGISQTTVFQSSIINGVGNPAALVFPDKPKQ